MRSQYKIYPVLLSEFQNGAEIGVVINRSVAYVNTRMTGQKDFTRNDKKMIASYLGRTDIEEIFRKATA